jgi:hypothetical protein
MKYTAYINVIIFCVLFFSCYNNSSYPNSSSYNSSIEELNDKDISFRLDGDTWLYIKSLFSYTDELGKEYLTFQNRTENELLFYDMASKELLFKVKFDIEGPNGVGRFIGYQIKNFNEIYLSSAWKKEIIKVDTAKNIINTIKYETTVNKNKFTQG